MLLLLLQNLQALEMNLELLQLRVFQAVFNVESQGQNIKRISSD